MSTELEQIKNLEEKKQKLEEQLNQIEEKKKALKKKHDEKEKKEQNRRQLQIGKTLESIFGEVNDMEKLSEFLELSLSDYQNYLQGDQHESII